MNLDNKDFEKPKTEWPKKVKKEASKRNIFDKKMSIHRLMSFLLNLCSYLPEINSLLQKSTILSNFPFMHIFVEAKL